MDPKTMVMMGMAGFIFLLFIIIGIIVWVNSGDESVRQRPQV